jgi:hypothetical protein
LKPAAKVAGFFVLASAPVIPRLTLLLAQAEWFSANAWQCR